MAEKVALINLGCPKNLVDAEVMLGHLRSQGYELTTELEAADVVVVNTCGFLEASAQESVDTLLAVAERKKDGKLRAVVAAGCMTQRYGADVADAMPEVDGFLGVGQARQLPEVVRRVLNGERTSILSGPAAGFEGYGLRVQATPSYTSYLKVSEGCDRKCAFCIIPQIRGSMVSRPVHALVQEAEALAAAGAREIILVGQDPTRYGIDLRKDAGRARMGGWEDGRMDENAPISSDFLTGPSPSPIRGGGQGVGSPPSPPPHTHTPTHLLPELLAALDQVRDLRWIRLMYLFPDRHAEPVLEAVVRLPKVCKYLDMPFQHAAPEVLRGMNRPGGAQEYLRLLAKVRAACPDLSLRSTFIVGFPGETERHFQELLEFVRDAQLDWVGVFRYSREDGTPAASLGAQVPRRVSKDRYDRLMSLQQEISGERRRRWLGRTVEVLVESAQGAAGTGRAAGQAPEIDGETRLDLAALPDTCPGDFVRAEVTGSGVYDLEARAFALAHRPPRPGTGLIQIGGLN